MADRVLLGVTGCIAAYKAAELVRALQKMREDVAVKVLMTPAAENFVGADTFRALTGKKVSTGIFGDEASAIPHIAFSQGTDVYAIAPCTANTLAKLACGMADNLVTAAALATDAPLVVVPAMNTQMWENPATQANIATLRERGVFVVEPAEGELACGSVGAGKFPEPDAVARAVLAVLDTGGERDLAGKRLLVTAGPTREPFDSVRFISNAASGKTGYLLAEQAALRGAQVTLVSGPSALADPAGVEVVRVDTAAEMLKACEGPFSDADAAVFTAAVSDWRAWSTFTGKIKNDGADMQLRLVPNTDIAATLGKRKGSTFCVVFAAETGDPREAARKKLATKHADMVVANDVTEGDGPAGADDNHVWLIASGEERELSRRPKSELAADLLDVVAAALSRTDA